MANYSIDGDKLTENDKNTQLFMSMLMDVFFSGYTTHVHTAARPILSTPLAFPKLFSCKTSDPTNPRKVGVSYSGISNS